MNPMLTLVLLGLALATGPVAEANSAKGTRPLADYGELARHGGRALMAKRKFKLGSKPGPSSTDSKCGEWKVGTATGYSTDGTDKGDKPMGKNDLGEYVVPGKFFWENNVLAIDWSDWKGGDRYRNVEVSLEGKVGTFQVWDFCNDKDCARDNQNCCSNNKQKYSKPGYLLDVETHACKRVWGLKGCQNWLVAPVYYRVCKKFDKKTEVKEYNMKCTGIKGDGKCSS